MVIRASDGVGIWTASGGHGPHLGLAHGGPGLWDYLAPFAAELAPFATVHRWDQRGGGRSERRGPYTIARLVADMDAVRAAAGIERWVAGGHSWGASLALAYAAAHPRRVRGVLYVAGVGAEWPRWRDRYRDELARRLGARDALQALSVLPEAEANRRRWTTDYADPAAAAPHVQRMLDTGYAVNLEANREIHGEFEQRAPELVAEVAHHRVPMLIVQGALDPRPIDAVDSMVTALPSGTVTRIVAPRGAHFPWVEEPDLVLTSIAGWLESLRA